MYLQGYSVKVYPGKEIAGGYVVVRHGDTYGITLRNSNNERCDAYLYIDGKFIGGYRINSHASVTIERPPTDTGKFTFYQSESGEFRTIHGDSIGKQDLGLIKVVFKPERVVVWEPVVKSVSRSFEWGGTSFACTCGQSAGLMSGATGLSGTSYQEFDTVAPLDYDANREITIYLRLAVDSNEPRPLTVTSSAIPPAV